MEEEAAQYSVHAVCRICLNRLPEDGGGPGSFDLFLIPGLAKKLCFCTSLAVEQSDGFPKSLCTPCYTRLDDLHEFQKLCVDSVQKFQDMVARNVFCSPASSQMKTFDVLNVAGNEAELVGQEEEDRINFDPLLDHKMELIENEEDVFKMLEHVDKEAEQVEKEVKQDEMDAADLMTILAADSSEESDDDFEQDVDFEPNSSDGDDDVPLAQRLRQNSRVKPKAKRRQVKEEDLEFINGSEEEEDEEGEKSKGRRRRIPPGERHLHRIIDCHICHQKFKKAIRYEEHMKHHNDLLPFQCKVETCRKGMQ